ncbi:MAG: glycosyl hydrolase family 17 protein [Terracidiphilus sp.]|jgi:exo-beta-1,3-glucanase (GH17 family)
MKNAFLKIVLACVLAFGLPALMVGADAGPRKIDLTKQQWNGNAIDYSGYRVGQSPELNRFPTQAQILEDLTILKKNWHLIRLYGADQHSQDVLEVIRHNKLGIKVLLGIWLDGRLGYESKNAEQVATGIRLANQYKKIVLAVSVGNEILVSWSDHQLTEEKATEYVAQVRAAVRCPVTVADDFIYWRKQTKLAEHVDFITMHAYPIWGREDIDTAMASTIKDYESVRKAHPGKTIVLGEAGWASFTAGDQHVPRAGDENKQKRYYEELTAWAKANNVTTFYFEAFDEPWKGNGTEGHWGLFSADRKAKLAMQGLYPELMPSGPTSPSYDLPPAVNQNR